MAEFDDLLAGIRAHPADELRRLVFADWLDENAHANPLWSPWATYIRWAVAATRTPRTDPDYWAYRRYPEPPPDGISELLELEAMHFRAEWHCGFPDTFALSADTLQEHNYRIAALPGPIRRLTVFGRYDLPHHVDLPPGDSPPERRPLPPYPTGWVSGPTVARAGTLDVSLSPNDAPLGLAALGAGAGRLPPLVLTLFAASPEVVAAFAETPLPSLIGLHVSHLSEPELLARSPNLAGVKSFSLGGVLGFTGRDTTLLERLPNLTRLGIHDGHEAFLAALARGCAPHLEHLETRAQSADSPGWSAFVRSSAFNKLTRLHWSGPSDDASAIWPADVPEPPAGELILNVAGIGPAGAPRAVAALFASPLLHRSSCLFVERCDLNARAYRALAANPSARNLKVLSIQMPFKSDPVASGKPFAELCRSPHLANLTELSLTFHTLTDDDLEELYTATFADGLRYLNLAGSYFSERVLEKLTDRDVLPALTWLDIHKPTNGSRRIEPALRERFGPHFAL